MTTTHAHQRHLRHSRPLASVLAAGGKLAHGAAIPTRQDGSPLFRPSAAGTAVGTALLACAALVAFNAGCCHRRRALDALGRRAGTGPAGPRHRRLRLWDSSSARAASAAGTAAVGTALLACAALVANAGCCPPSAARWTRWAGAAPGLLVRAIGDFGYVGFFKRKGGNPFARLDTRVYSPLCLLLAAGTLAASWPLA